MKDTIEIRHLGITVKVTREHVSRFIIPDYTTGTRIRHVRTTEASAKEKAKEICGILANGKQQDRALIGDDDLKFEFRRAKEILQPTGLRLTRAAQVVVDCCELVTVDEIVSTSVRIRPTELRSQTK